LKTYFINQDSRYHHSSPSIIKSNAKHEITVLHKGNNRSFHNLISQNASQLSWVSMITQPIKVSYIIFGCFERNCRKIKTYRHRVLRSKMLDSERTSLAIESLILKEKSVFFFFCGETPQAHSLPFNTNSSL